MHFYIVAYWGLLQSNLLPALNISFIKQNEAILVFLLLFFLVIEWRDVRIASSVIFVALSVSVEGMKSKSWWRSIWMMITYSHENGWTVGKRYSWKEVPDCCLKGVLFDPMLWKTRTPTNCTLASNLRLNVLSLLVVICFLSYFHSFQ